MEAMYQGPALAGRAEYEAWLASETSEIARRHAYEGALFAETAPFSVQGICAACSMSAATFRVDFSYAWETGEGRLYPNWREHLTCTQCGLNNRMRATIGMLRELATPADTVYLTERLTALYRVAARIFPNITGSEYLRDGTPNGMANDAGVRHEDVTRLSFPDQSVDVIGTFDVLEHVPLYREALGEFHRCLRSGGRLLISIPFSLFEDDTTARAIVLADGSIQHLKPPEYHGDPLDENGALCFHNFGWSFLRDLSEAGFSEPRILFYWSRDLAYLGDNQFIITALRS